MAVAKKSENQVMDVSKPGKVPASSSARPIIVGHGPRVQDPMVTSAEEASPDNADTEEVIIKSPSASKRVISPITDDAETDAATEDSAGADTVSEATDEPSVDESDENSKGSTEQEISDSPTDAAVVDSVIDQVDIGSKQEAEQQAQEERKKQEAIDKLIAEKKYFVPIGKTHKKSNRGITIFTLFLLMVFVGLIAAIDAEMLEVSFNLPFDLIK